VPTLREQGVAVELLNWRGVVGPPGLSRAERDALLDLVRRMTRTSQWTSALARSGWTDIYMEGDEFGRFVSDESRRVTSAMQGKDPPTQGVYEAFVLFGLAISLAAVITQAIRGRTPSEPRKPSHPGRTAL